MSDYKATILWKQLETLTGTEASAARSLLTLEMPKIHTILTQGQTSPTDFTLHDADHSFRVAKWMAEIIPTDVLSGLHPYEFALLLLSAFLHDIGMTPEQGRIERLWFHLAYGAPESKSNRKPLTDDEVLDLQAWLDDEGYNITLPLASDGKMSEVAKRSADLLIAHYCRHKHNDWSSEWIKTHLRNDALPGYENWVDDLIQLCRSHHEGYDELKQERFNPRPAGLIGQPIHHRYMACVLRLADVLEIDPERTPEVIFRHRAIHPGSLLYWRKDHEAWIIRNPGNIILIAYPEGALIENAIRKTVIGIQQELQLCARLNREQPFFYWPLRPSQPLPHRWEFPEVITTHIQSKNEAYVYIDGAFRPNTERLLDLLSGSQLYQGPLVSVRELLQNAFDAVREEIAYQRLEQLGAASRPETLCQIHQVELRLQEDNHRWWLCCRDTGVGMTRRIIEEYLLVSGNRQRRELLELERRCRRAGFRLGRTAQFGIGVLSYFMLADRIEVRTRRSPMREDAEGTGWFFSTEGVGSFGELRKDSAALRGTEVRLRLKESSLRDPEKFAGELARYLLQTIAHVPCGFQLHMPMMKTSKLSWSPGWAQPIERFGELMVKNLTSSDAYYESLISVNKREQLDLERKSWEEWSHAIQACIRWATEEGDLPERLGAYKISAPFFELPNGRCGIFFLIDKDRRWKRIAQTSGKFALAPSFEMRESFCGMRLTQSNRLRGPFLIEIDWESERVGSLRVDRESIKLSDLAVNAMQWVKQRAEDLIASTLGEVPESEYADLNASLFASIPPSGRLWWAFRKEIMKRDDDLFWAPVSPPFILEIDVKDYQMKGAYLGQNVAILEAIDLILRPDRNLQGRLLPYMAYLEPDRVAVISKYYGTRFSLVRLWTSASGKSRTIYPLGLTSEFPNSWLCMCGASFSSGSPLIWNRSHPMVTQVDEDANLWFWNLCRSSKGSPDLLSVKGEVLATSGRAARAIAWIFQANRGDVWTALAEAAPNFTRELLRQALRPDLESKPVVCFWGEDKLLALDRHGFREIDNGDPDFKLLMPYPGDAWIILSEHIDSESARKVRDEAIRTFGRSIKGPLF